MTKNIDFYMGLKYKINAVPIDEADGGGILLEMPELGRLSTCAWGETYDKAYAMLRDIQRDNIEDLITQGFDVPMPLSDEDYSGRLNLRMPKSLHRRLAEIAHEEGYSLNSLIVNLLYERLGGLSVGQSLDNAVQIAEKLLERIHQEGINLNIQHGIMSHNQQRHADEASKRLKEFVNRADDNEFSKVG
jgi:predicted RNase H-like HicB family nuclease